MANLPDNMPKILRSYGLKVVVVPGWRTRGRPASTGTFNPVGVLWHHTATAISSSIAAILSLLVRGRSDLPGPLAQFGLGRDGTVYLIAAGRANHAGAAKSAGSVASGDGNSLYIGIEAFNNGVGEKWPQEQLLAYVLLSAVLSIEITGNSAKTINGHKETSITGKIDPNGIDMSWARGAVAAKIAELQKPKPVPVASRGKLVDAALKSLRRAKRKARGTRRQQIAAAIAATKMVKPVQRTEEH